MISISRRQIALAGAALVLVAAALSIARVPGGSALAVIWPRAEGARLHRSGLAFAPPLVTVREVLPLSDGRALVTGEIEAASREGTSVHAAWEAAIGGDWAPATPDGVAAFVRGAVAERLRTELAALSAAQLAAGAPLALRLDFGGAALDLVARPRLAGDAAQQMALAKLRASLPPRRGRVLLIGWDGADWQLLDPLLAQGKLPHLASLVRRGVTADLATVKPLVSPLIWTTIATGVPPDEHGILDFLRPSRPGAPPEPVSAADRRVPALWTIASGLGRRVGVTAWWASWPAERIDGWVVSDRVAYQLLEAAPQGSAGDLVSPPASAASLLRLRRPEAEVSDAELARYVDVAPGALAAARATGRGYDDPLLHLARTVAATDTYQRMTLAAMREHSPDLVLHYVEATDTIGHLFGAYVPPRRDHIAEADFARYRRAVPAMYQRCDELLGELVAAAGPDTTVILVSDHGFHWGEGRPRQASGTHTATAAWWHRDTGVLVAAGPGMRPDTRRGKAHVLDVAPTVLVLLGLPAGSGWRGRVPGWANAVPQSPPVDYAALLPATTVLAGSATAAADAEMVERLRSLGYIGSAPGAGQAPPAAETTAAKLNRGSVLLDRGDAAGAESAYREALALDPQSSGAWLKLAVALLRQEKLGEALTSYREALARAADDAHRESARLGAALVLSRTGRGAEALAELRLGVAEVPSSAVLWRTLGAELVAGGALAEARDAYARASDLAADPETLNALAALEIKVRGDRRRAAELWRRSLALAPDQPATRRMLAEVER